jgi:diadenylate cyclase
VTETFFRDVLVFVQGRSWRDALDIFVVAFLAYRLLVLIRGTRAVQLLAGIGVLALVGLAARVLRLELTSWIFSNLTPALLIGVVILFQPELRRALDRVGRVGFLGRPLAHYNLQLMSRLIDEVTRGVEVLSERRTGALIVFEREVGLENYALTGVRITGEVSCELLQTIFFPNSPLHDGAAIIRGNQLVAAGCLLPLVEEVRISSGRIGTRHRAALGMSLESDAVIVVVSEETGRISIAQDGQLRSGLNTEDLRGILLGSLLRRRPSPRRARFFPRRDAPAATEEIPATATAPSNASTVSQQPERPGVVKTVEPPPLVELARPGEGSERSG